MSSPRLTRDIARHIGYASRAARTAASTSLALEHGAVPITSRVSAGL
jgi:hypothetical protein